MRTKALIGVLLFSLIFITTGCKKKDVASFDALEKAPLAKSVALKKIETDKNGNNLILYVTFDSEVPKGGFTINEDEGTTTYHDDGEDDDKKKGDGIYTAKVKVDYSEIDSFIKETNRSKSKNVLSFRNRRVEGNQTVNQLSVTAFGNRNEILINRAVPFDEKLRDHSLVITDPAVIKDPTRTLFFNGSTWVGKDDGVWTFGYLMRQMANQSVTGVTPEDFTKKWLEIWLTNVDINGDRSQARTGMQNVINNWPKITGTTNLDLNKAPFNLTAIINRVDLKGNTGYGGTLNGLSAGEGRFVFTLINGGGTFNVIFEYGYNFKKEAPLRAYQQKWASLKDKAFGSVDYNKTLEELTGKFTNAKGNLNKPNQNCINQIRTNEVAFGSWELREFHLDATSHLLKQVSPNREPQDKYNAKLDNADVRFLANWVNTHSGKISTAAFDPQLASASSKNPGANKIWDGIPTPATAPPVPGFITNDDDRFDLSINTCSGCHGSESGSGFTHIDANSNLSPFLNGGGFNQTVSVTDGAGRPNGSPKVRKFNDLDNRGQILHKFAGLPPAISKLLIEPVISSD